MTYQYFIDTLDIDSIESVAKSNLTKDEKTVLIAFHILKNKEGFVFEIPSKKHKIETAKLLVKYGISERDVVDKLGVSPITYYRLKREIRK